MLHQKLNKFQLLIFLCEIFGVCLSFNNVCRTLQDYKTIQKNQNCWYNPDVDAIPPTIVKRYGYPFEKYKITTKDGYVISLFRIPHNNIEMNMNRVPVLLQHGIGLDSFAWLMTGKNSPAFQLSNKGFDVWLGNARGTRFSIGHLNYTLNDAEYWNYSFHETGFYDFPAMIDFISAKTRGNGKITVIGHSMGSTSSLVYASLNSKHAQDNLSRIISLAPVANLYRTKSVLKTLVPFRFALKEFLGKFGLHALGQFTKLQQDLMRKTCERYPLINVCLLLNVIVTGWTVEEFQPQYFPVFLSNYPTGISVKTIWHYAQIIEARGRFQQFDYENKSVNLKFYNSTKPPEYDLTKITVPVHLLYGENDILADKLDVKVLFNKLQTEKTMISIFEDRNIFFSHNDFIYGKDIDILYDFISEKLIKNKAN